MSDTTDSTPVVTENPAPILEVVAEALETSGLHFTPEQRQIVSDYVRGLRAKIEDVAVRKARRHGWCSEFGQALAQMFPDGPVDGTDSWRDSQGLDCRNQDRDGFNEEGYDTYGYNRDGFDAAGYNRQGVDIHGYDRHGFDTEGLNFWGWKADDYGPASRYGEGRRGYDPDGYGWTGFNEEGYDRLGRDSGGYDRDGFSYPGPFNRSGWDSDGYNSLGRNTRGYNRLGISGYGDSPSPGQGHRPTMDRVKAELVAKRAANNLTTDESAGDNA